MSTNVLYLGDTVLDGAASYLAGILTHCEIGFDYIDSATACPVSQLAKGYDALVISDYMASCIVPALFEDIVARTRAGMGLLMIGGWESFTGLGGDYHATPLAEILPVQMKGMDDRVNSFSPCMIRPEAEHPITSGLPFATHSAAINGYNQFRAKPETETLLSVKRYRTAVVDGEFEFVAQGVDPLLVVDRVHDGRVACYAGDVAPHWAGGFVDWGESRHAVQAPGAGEVEIGNWYIKFFENLIRWVSRSL